jgi:hypothetical protein
VTRSLLAVALASFLLPGATVAAGNGAAVVRGTQLAYGTCGASDGYAMTGDLVGCWWITSFESSTDPDKHNVRATGEELFVGWIGSRYGSFTTTFVYTAKMDGPWVSSAEIHGRCHHPITSGSGTGDFLGISGELSFKDVVDVDPPFYPYWGSVRIAGEELTIGTTTIALKSRGAASTTASSC